MTDKPNLRHQDASALSVRKFVLHLKSNAQRAAPYWPLFMCYGLILLLYREFIFSGKVLVFGDNAEFSIPLMALLKNSLAEGTLPFWSDLIYGGHPVFAEGQTGALNPIVALSAIIFEPARAVTAIHLASQLLTALGVFLLCRELGRSILASSFAALVVTFSILWLGEQHNHAPAMAMSLVPFSLWTFERLYRLRTARAAAWFSLALTVQLVSGYPPYIYSLTVFLLARLAAGLFNADERSYLKQNLGLLSLLGGLAVILTLGASAAQMAPLVELAANSNRADGIGAGLFPNIVLAARGLVFAINAQSVLDQNPGAVIETIRGDISAYPSLGSVLVLFLALLSLYHSRQKPVIAYFCATGLMLFFTFERSLSWPLLSDFFKIVSGHIFFRNAAQDGVPFVIGSAVLSAFALDLTEQKLLLQRKVLLAAMILFVAGVLALAWSPYAPVIQLIVLIAAVGALFIMKRKAAASVAVMAVLVFEILFVKLNQFPFYHVETKPPHFAEYIAPEEINYKVIDMTSVLLLAMFDRSLSGGDTRYRNMIEALTPSTNMHWGVPSVQGTMALYSANNVFALDTISKELKNQSTENYPALRLMDILSVKYVIARGETPVPPGMRRIAGIGEFNLNLLENDNALAPVRFYADAKCQPSPQAVVDAIYSAQSHSLHLFPDCPEIFTKNSSSGGIAANGEPSIEITKAGPTHYEFNVAAPTAGWLFLADRNFPGWKAYRNGVPTPVYSAQILGKAIRVEAGENRVKLVFDSNMIRYGFISSGVFLMLIFFIVSGIVPAILNGGRATHRP